MFWHVFAKRIMDPSDHSYFSTSSHIHLYHHFQRTHHLIIHIKLRTMALLRLKMSTIQWANFFSPFTFEDDSEINSRVLMQIMVTQTIIILIIPRCPLFILMVLIGLPILPNVYTDTIVRMSLRTLSFQVDAFAIVVLLSCFFIFMPNTVRKCCSQNGSYLIPSLSTYHLCLLYIDNHCYSNSSLSPVPVSRLYRVVLDRILDIIM